MIMEVLGGRVVTTGRAVVRASLYRSQEFVSLFHHYEVLKWTTQGRSEVGVGSG